MKISNKITIFVFIALAVLVTNNIVALTRLSRIENELKDVVNQDIVLKDVITSINQRQLKKAIQFQRVLRIAEELGFESLTLARRNHLVAHTKHVQTNFENLSSQVLESINQAQLIVEQRLGITDIPIQQEQLAQIQTMLTTIKNKHASYDKEIAHIFSMIIKGGYMVSFEDIKSIYREEGRLSNDLQLLIDRVKDLARQSLVRAEDNEQSAKKIMWIIFFLTAIFTVATGIGMMLSITRPLKRLLEATQKISDGKFSAKVEVKGRDEIAEVGGAFNKMSDKLAEFKEKIEQANQELSVNLEMSERRKKDLEKVNTELDEFVHTVSHDIRAPLMGVRWYAAYLDKHYKDQLDKKGNDCVDGISKGINRLNAMIDDLLSLTRISRVRNPYSQINVSGIVKAVLERLEILIQEKNIDIHIQEHMPVVFCDQIKLTEVFLNLISNAIKFSSKNTRPRVDISYRDRPGFVEFSVKDNGIGIASEHHQEIFEAFKRLHNVNEYEGTGAGLNIVKRIVEEHGGNIWIESAEGQGSIFIFTISKNLSNSN